MDPVVLSLQRYGIMHQLSSIFLNGVGKYEDRMSETYLKKEK